MSWVHCWPEQAPIAAMQALQKQRPTILMPAKYAWRSFLDHEGIGDSDSNDTL